MFVHSFYLQKHGSTFYCTQSLSHQKLMLSLETIKFTLYDFWRSIFNSFDSKIFFNLWFLTMVVSLFNQIFHLQSLFRTTLLISHICIVSYELPLFNLCFFWIVFCHYTRNGKPLMFEIMITGSTNLYLFCGLNFLFWLAIS